MRSATRVAAIPASPPGEVLLAHRAALVTWIEGLLSGDGSDREADVHLRDLRASFSIPFESLADRLRLQPIERAVVAAATASALALDLRPLVQRLRPDSFEGRLDLATLFRGLGMGRSDVLRVVDRVGPGDRLEQAGLVRYTPGGRALDAEPRATDRLLGLLRGEIALESRLGAWCDLWTARARGRLGIVDDVTWQRLEWTVKGLTRTGGVQLLVRGPDALGKARLGAALGAAVGNGHALHADARVLPAAELATVVHDLVREAMLLGATLVISHVAEGSLVPVLVERTLRELPALVVLTSCAQWSSPSLHFACDVARPARTLRAAAWEAELDEQGIPTEERPEPQALADAVPIGRPAVARAVALARAARLPFAEAAAAQVDSELGRFAQRRQPRGGMAGLVLSADTRGALEEIVVAARHRTSAPAALAVGRGICALFNGPPGTGKSLGAEAVAAELAIPLYRIDVSRIVDRFVGETEKNLVRLFEEAASDQAALLFDEADSLFARRTEVRDAQDRYANMQVNQLLNLIEDYEGVVFLTTNMKGALDAAVLRRITFKVSFDRPDVPERIALWSQHLAKVGTAAEIDLEALAREFRASGGEIKNAVYRAALVAGNGPVEEGAVRRAIRSEMIEGGSVA